jgi:hypothetical protein
MTQQIRPRAFFQLLPASLKTIVVLIGVGMILLFVTAPDRPSAFTAIVAAFSAAGVFGTMAWAYQFVMTAQERSEAAFDRADEAVEIVSRIVEIAQEWHANPKTRELGEQAMKEIGKAWRDSPENEGR